MRSSSPAGQRRLLNRCSKGYRETTPSNLPLLRAIASRTRVAIILLSPPSVKYACPLFDSAFVRSCVPGRLADLYEGLVFRLDEVDDAFLLHRVAAAFYAIAVRCAFVSAFARAGPPFFPRLLSGLRMRRCPVFPFALTGFDESLNCGPVRRAVQQRLRPLPNILQVLRDRLFGHRAIVCKPIRGREISASAGMPPASYCELHLSRTSPSDSR